MPDSFPPLSWGPPPFEERDLDALLSGETVDIPLTLRQVADALVALRAAPTTAELSGEANIMAEFSAVAEFRALGLSEAARAGGEAHTLVLPAVPGGDVPPRRGARHRVRRAAQRPPGRRPVSRRAGVVLGGAAAALVVATAALAASLHGPSHPSHPSAVQSSTSHSATGSGVSASEAANSAATEHPSHPASSRAAGPGVSVPPSKSKPAKMCRAYFDFLRHPGPKSKLADEVTLYWQLVQLAGGPDKVLGFCGQYIKNMHDLDGLFADGTAPQPGQENPRPGNQGGNQQGPGSDPPPQPTATASPSQRP
jgi:hypothetical protein